MGIMKSQSGLMVDNKQLPTRNNGLNFLILARGFGLWGALWQSYHLQASRAKSFRKHKEKPILLLALL
jgi:hypothetical protein